MQSSLFLIQNSSSLLTSGPTFVSSIVQRFAKLSSTVTMKRFAQMKTVKKKNEAT